MNDRDRQSLVLVGGGGHACVVLDAARANGVVVSGFLDDDPNALLARTGLLRLGTLSHSLAGLPWHLAIGSIETRERWLTRFPAHDSPPTTIVHPSAHIAADATIGPGTLAACGAIVQPHAAVGANVILNTAVICEHHCLIGDNSHVAPGAVLGGGCRVGEGTLIGLGARVLPGVRIGSHATIGAGAVVCEDVTDGSTYVGVPARRVA